MTSSKRGLSHVARLLEHVLMEAQIAPSRLAQHLGIATDQLQAYCSGAERMSTDQQIDLATLVLVQYPNCSRLAHRVAAQAKAESAFHSKVTETHSGGPPSRFRW